MTSRKHLAVGLGLGVTALLIGLALLLASQGRFAPSKQASGDQLTKAAQTQLALKDLEETRDEIAKMKAHGIGMPEAKPATPVN